MMQTRPKLKDASRSVRALAGQAVRRQIRRLESGRDGLCLLPRMRDAYDTKFGRHLHLFPELFVQVRCCSVMRFPGETITIRPGNVLLVPSGVPHKEFTGKRSRNFRNFVFLYSARYVYLHAGGRTEDSPQPLGMDYEVLACEPTDAPARYLNDIITLSNAPTPTARTAIRGLWLATFACLLRALDAPAPAQADDFDVIRQCHGLIAQRLNDPRLSVKTLAGWIGCSADYLSHAFHLATGTRLSRFIQAQRIRQARSLLAGSTMNISEIARACGYRDPGYFTRVFRQLTGRPPLTWRKWADKNA